MSSPAKRVRCSPVRYTVPPRDVPPTKIARLLHLTLAEFEARLPELIRRGFPQADRTTGHYDLKVVNEWMDRRHERPDEEQGNDIARQRGV